MDTEVQSVFSDILGNREIAVPVVQKAKGVMLRGQTSEKGLALNPF